MELTQRQLQRLYMVFDFEDYEEIVSATIESEVGGWMKITYIDHKVGMVGEYQPYIAKHSDEDLWKLAFILNGLKLSRMA